MRNTTNVRSVGKPLPVPHTFFDIRESILVRNPISVRTGGKLFAVTHNLVFIRLFILVRDAMNVRNVGMCLTTEPTSKNSYWRETS